MSAAQPLRVPSWTVVEAGDRWFQAVLRFTAASVGQHRGSVHHLNIAAASELPARLDLSDGCLCMVLWEIPAEPQARLSVIDVIASVRQSDVRVVQLAYLCSPQSQSLALAIQEAGVTVLLSELWALEPLIRRLAGRVA